MRLRIVDGVWRSAPLHGVTATFNKEHIGVWDDYTFRNVFYYAKFINLEIVSIHLDKLSPTDVERLRELVVR